MTTEDSYQRDCDNIDEIQLEDRQEKMKKEKAKASHINWKLHNEKINSGKLVAPNGNYKVANCLVCGKEFIKRTTTGPKQLAAGIRGRASKNCSRQCSRMYKRKPNFKVANAEKSNNQTKLEGKK